MKHRKPTRRRPPQFDLIAGHACLDFVNTLDDRHTRQPKELVNSYRDLVAFTEDVGWADPSHADRLLQRCHREPERAETTLQRAKILREAIHDVFWEMLNHRPAPAEALAKLNAEVRTAALHLRLVPVRAGFEWQFGDLDDPESPLWLIARSAADLLASAQVPFVRACSSKSCEWFFLDTSKNHRRRWCDMKRCGNREKVRRFYARQKSA